MLLSLTIFYYYSFLELLRNTNYRLPLVKEEDKDEYLRDFINEVKKSKVMKIIKDQKTGEKFFEYTADLIYGIASKPL